MRKLMLLLLAVAGIVAGSLPALAATDHAVAVKDDLFDPQTITIATGDSVTWSREGIAPHNIHFNDGSFTEPAQPSSTWTTVTRTFTTPGTYSYVCMQHANMTGTVVVNGPSSTGPPPASTATPTPTPAASASPSARAARLSVRRAVSSGRVRGSIDAGPAGARLTLKVTIGGRAAGSASRSLVSDGTVSFAVRLDAAARRRLARRGRLDATVRAAVTIGDSTARRSTLAHLRR